jgi:hypothetical protein
MLLRVMPARDDAGARRISAETAGRVPRLGAPHRAIIVTNQDSIYGRLTDDLLTMLTMSKLRIYARTLLQPLDETMSTLSTMSECQNHCCRTSAFSAIERVNALTCLALQIGNEPSTDAGAT